MDYKDLAGIVGIVAFNLACIWVLFLGGADWLEGPLASGLFGAMYTRRFSGADLSAESIKMAAAVLLFLEALLVITVIIAAAAGVM
jgi:hypothetical protein